MADIREVDLRIHPLAKHVQVEVSAAYVAGALAVSRKGSLRCGQLFHVAQPGGCYRRSTIVVWMQGQDNESAACEVAAPPMESYTFGVAISTVAGGSKITFRSGVGCHHTSVTALQIRERITLCRQTRGVSGETGLTLHLVGKFLIQLSPRGPQYQ